jgi:hypothetical protein
MGLGKNNLYTYLLVFNFDASYSRKSFAYEVPRSFCGLYLKKTICGVPSNLEGTLYFCLFQRSYGRIKYEVDA